MVPIIKNDSIDYKIVNVVDEYGNRYKSTYKKRAKGLVKNGRARYINDDTICLACPPRNLTEEFIMNNNENINANAINDVSQNQKNSENTVKQETAAPAHTPSINIDLYEKQFTVSLKNIDILKSVESKASMFQSIVNQAYTMLDMCVNSKMNVNHASYAEDIAHEREVIQKIINLLQQKLILICNSQMSYDEYISNIGAFSPVDKNYFLQKWHNENNCINNCNNSITRLINHVMDYDVNVWRVIRTGTWVPQANTANNNAGMFSGMPTSVDKLDVVQKIIDSITTLEIDADEKLNAINEVLHTIGFENFN